MGLLALECRRNVFNYEEHYGCDEDIPELNARARRNGYVSVFGKPEEYYNANEYVDEKAEAINAELRTDKFRKEKSKEKEVVVY